MNCPICWNPAFAVPVPGKPGRTQVLCNCGQKDGKFRSVIEYDTGVQPLPMMPTITPQRSAGEAWKDRKKKATEDVS